MATIGMLLQAVGGIVGLVGFIMIVVAAFKESVGWGLGSLFCGIVALIYVAKHWEETKQPFLIWLAGFVMSMLGAVLAGMGAAGNMGAAG